MSQNPYTVSFGRKPGQVIPRLVETNEILDNFSSGDPSVQGYMISGVRGTGKTVLLTDIASVLKKRDEWIIVELNPERDMLLAMAAALCSETKLASIFKSAKINLSFFGMGLEVSGEAPITDIEIALRKMLLALKKKGKRILIEIDEVTDSKPVREFAAAFQILLRQEFPVFLLMTGLYENIYELQNEKSLTFLYRAPKIKLGPLNMGAIAANYEDVLHKGKKDALRMAELTKGYAFAFQVMGYLTWQAEGDYMSMLRLYRQYLEEYVYEKIWSELSPKDQKVLTAITEVDDGRISVIREKLDMTSDQFNPYRIRLIRKGIVDGNQRGIVKIVLPMFKEFVSEMRAGLLI